MHCLISDFSADEYAFCKSQAGDQRRGISKESIIASNEPRKIPMSFCSHAAIDTQMVRDLEVRREWGSDFV